jgi:leader peptidase (prepilin peptidase)/N-methyltransferase
MTSRPARRPRIALRHLPHLLYVTPLLRRLITSYTVGEHCGHCATPTWPAACHPPARCRGCRRTLGPPPYTVETAATATVALMLWSGASGWELAAYTTWALIMVVLGFVDAATYRLPHRLTTAATLGLVALLIPTGSTLATWLTAIAAAVGLATLHAALHLAAPSGLGLGDVTMTIPVGFALGWLDWRYPVAAVFLAHVATLLAFASGSISGKQNPHQPFGTHLAAIAVCLAALAQLSNR